MLTVSVKNLGSDYRMGKTRLHSRSGLAAPSGATGTVTSTRSARPAATASSGTGTTTTPPTWRNEEGRSSE